MPVKKTNTNTGLTFTAKPGNANIHLAEGDNDVSYKITNVNGVFKVSADGEVIAQGLRGYPRAVDAANKHLADNPADEPEPVKQTTRKPAGKTTPASKPAASASKSKVKPFPEYDAWLSEQEPRVKVGKGKETPEQYTNRTNNLAYGRAKGKYNRENGLTGTPAASTRKPAEPKEPVDREELYGARWNDFGEADVLTYELSRVENAYASVAYSIEHGKVHPHSPIAANSYFKAVERAYTSEARLMAEVEARGLKLPKGFECRYYGLTLADVDETEQTALSGYLAFYEESPEQANKEAKQTVKGKVTLNAEGLTLYPLVSVKPKRSAGSRR